MKRIAGIAAITLLLGWMGAFVPAPAAAAEQSIPLTNPGFEEPAADGVVPGWSQTYGRGGVAVSMEAARTGEHSLKIVDPDSANYGFESNRIAAEPGQFYTASGYVRSSSSGSLYLQFHDKSGTRIGHRSVSGGSSEGWTAITASLESPPGTASVSILLYSGLANTGESFFDDVSLSKRSDSPSEHVVRIGTAIHSVTIPHAAYGQGPDGENYIYATSNGNPAILTVLKAETGERIATFPLQNAGYSWGSTTAPNGDVYIGTQREGLLYRHVPGSGSVANLGRAIGTETHIWRVVTDEEGNVYGGTYPNGKVFKYDPDTDAFRDYGQMAQGEQYVRSIAYGNGKVYAGTGAVQAQLFELDPDSGVKTAIPLPDGYRHHKEVYDLTFTADLLFTRLTYSDPGSSLNNVTLVYDTTAGEWIGELPGTIGLDVSPAGPDGKVYFVQNGILTSYNAATGAVEPTSFAFGNAASRGFGWYELDIPGWNGPSLVTINSRAGIYAYNPIADEGRTLQGDALGSANSIRSIGTGPDGNIYVGGYLSPSSMTRFRLDTFAMESLQGMSQIEGMGIFQDKLMMGVYPGAAVYEYDPALPYDPNKRSNPTQLELGLSSEYQDRPFALADAGGKLAIGTAPIVGKLGGAVTIYDPVTGSVDIYSQMVENESPMALVHKDGLLYGGTSVWGGIAAEPVEQDGTLFIFDMNSRQKVFEMNPIPGERAITSLAFGPDGLLWGLTNGKLFAFDTDTLQVVRTKELYPYTWSDIVLAAGTLNFHSDGLLYGEAAGRLFRLDPQTWEHETLAEGANYFAQDEFGRIFYSSASTELFMYDDIPPAFAPGTSLETERTASGDLTLYWTSNADMKLFKITLDDVDVTGLGELVFDGAAREASFRLPAAAAGNGRYSVTPIDYTGNLGEPLTADLSSSVRLASLTANTGEWSHSFSPDRDSYGLNVWPSVKSVLLTAAAEDPKAVITMNNIPVAAGTEFEIKLDNKGAAEVIIEVTAADGSGTAQVNVDIAACRGPKDSCGLPPGQER